MATKSSTKNKSTLTGTNAADVLTVKHSQVTVKAGKGNDKITVSKGASNVLYGGAGADTITIGKSAGKGNKVYGDAGNDTIKVNTKYGVTIDGGAGNDKIYGGKGDDTFTGGAGKDTFFYANGDGKDTITDYQAGQDTLQITSGSISKTAVAKNKKDLVFSVGKGTITLKNAAGKKISMKDTRGTYTTTSALITLGKDFTGTMDATKYVSTIKGIDARNVTKAVTIIGNSQANTIFPGKGGGTYRCGAGKDTITISGSAKYTIYGDAGDDNIDIGGSSTGNTVYGNDGNDTIRVTNGKSVVDGGAGDDTINIGGGSNHIISGGAGNDTIRIGGGKNSVISGGSGTDTFNHTSGTASIKDYAAEETLSFANAITGATVSGQNITLTAGENGSVTVENGVGKLTRITDAGTEKSIFITSSATFCTDNDDIIVISGDDNFVVKAEGGNDTIYSNDRRGNSLLYGGDGNDTIYGGWGNDQLDGGEGNDTLYGGGGQDALIGETGDDTLYGGGGNDWFHYGNGDGNDTVRDYTENEDTLCITVGKITKTELSGNHVVFTVGTGSITLQNAVAKSISLEDSRGSYAVSNTAIELGKDFKDTMDANAYLSTVTTIDGRNATKTVNITGNVQNNTIYASKAGGTVNGGAGDDTIIIDGGENSVIYGDAGTDTFNFISGTATIKDYEAGETLSCAYYVSGVSVEGQNITLDGGLFGSVTVENGVGKLTQFNHVDQKKSIIYAESDYYGTDNDEVIIATGNDNISIFAQGGDDFLYGGYKQNGGTGNDQLFSGSSTQHMFGGDDSDFDVFYFSSDSYKGEIGIYDFKMNDDMIEFMDEGENTVSVVGDPWRDGNDVCLTLSNGSNLRVVNYAEADIGYIDLRTRTFYNLPVNSQT